MCRPKVHVKSESEIEQLKKLKNLLSAEVSTRTDRDWWINFINSPIIYPSVANYLLVIEPFGADIFVDCGFIAKLAVDRESYKKCLFLMSREPHATENSGIINNNYKNFVELRKIGKGKYPDIFKPYTTYFDEQIENHLKGRAKWQSAQRF